MAHGNTFGAPDIRTVPVYIYGLRDPRDRRIRYVGRSSDPRGRIASHRHHTGADAVRAWFATLAEDNLEPELVTLHTVVPGDNAEPWEEYFIRQYIRNDLLNSQLGPAPSAVNAHTEPEVVEPLTTKVKMEPNAARDALRAALREPGRSQVWLSHVLGVGQPTISGWLSGKFRPRTFHREALAELLGIPEDDWMDARERALTERLRSALHLQATGTDGEG